MQGALLKSLSVVVPAFNAESFIGETLTAILAQGVAPENVFVVNDGSTDRTEAIVCNQGMFGRISYSSTLNQGQGAARKYGISLTRTEYICLCDSDDVWGQDYLHRKVQLLHRYPRADFMFSNCFSFDSAGRSGHQLFDEAPAGWLHDCCVRDEDGFITVNTPYRSLLRFNPAYPSGLMFRRDGYDRMGGFLEKYSRWIAEDSEFTRRFASLDGCLFVGDTRATWGYRRHSSNYSAVQWKNIKAKADILDEHLKLGVVPSQYRAETERERDLTRGAAFDQACWESAGRRVVAELYAELPGPQRTSKRRAKALLAKAGLFA